MEPYEVLLPLAPWEAPDVLAAALGSIRQQTLPTRRVVISCDGSPPATLRRVLSQADLPLLIVEGPGGEGVGPVLARGLARCSCEIVLRADADDISLPDRARLQVQAMTARPHVVALSCPVLEFEKDPTRCLRMRTVPTDSTSIQAFSRWRNPLNHPAVVLRRRAILALGNYRSCPGFEDYDLWLRVLGRFGAGSLANLASPLVLVRIGPDHLTRRRGWTYAHAELRFLHRVIRERLLPRHQALLLLLMRPPLRLLPEVLLKLVMANLTRRGVKGAHASVP